MDESVLPLTGEVLMRVLDAISLSAAPGSELLFAHASGASLRPSQPGPARSALEVQLQTAPGEHAVARYPRLRVMGSDAYDETLKGSFEAMNVVSSLQGGVGAPAVMHLVVV